MPKITITERRCDRCGKIGTVPWPNKKCPDCTKWAKQNPTKAK
jgi:lipopolysaccharide biosynthesis regulator YciM